MNPVLAFHRPHEGGPWLLAFDGLAQLLRASPTAAPTGEPARVDREAPALAQLMAGGCAPEPAGFGPTQDAS